MTVTVTLRVSNEHVEVTRQQASLMRMRGTALTLAEESASIRVAFKSHVKALDKARWRVLISGHMGPMVMQMQP